ncbi:MAG: cbb3-type cytochrome oxidase assembly protein CcoS [Bdellovibrionota bacterium]
MNVLYVLIPVALALGISGLVAFLLAARSGQFDDLETPAIRALIDETEKEPKQ